MNQPSLTEIITSIKKGRAIGNAGRIVAIDGPAGAGKTTLANRLKENIQDSSIEIVHMDDLYDGWDNALSTQLTETLLHIAHSHKNAQRISLSTYDWNSGSFLPATELAQSELIIFEGVGSGQLAIREYLSALIWIDIDESEGLARVLARDGKEIEGHMKEWLATQEQHFRKEGTQNAADFVLTT